MKEIPNLEYINKLAKEDENVKNKLIASLKTEFSSDVINYEKSIQNLNFFESSECVHKLKNKISILGLDKSYFIAENFEKDLTNENLHLQKKFEQILKIIKYFLKNL